MAFPTDDGKGATHLWLDSFLSTWCSTRHETQVTCLEADLVRTATPCHILDQHTKFPTEGDSKSIQKWCIVVLSKTSAKKTRQLRICFGTAIATQKWSKLTGPVAPRSSRQCLASKTVMLEEFNVHHTSPRSQASTCHRSPPGSTTDSICFMLPGSVACLFTKAVWT